MDADSRKTPGTLVVFEGIDGTGKSTQAELLERALAARGIDVVRSREPTSGPHGKRIREASRTCRLPVAEELELFVLDRREHVAEVIAPALTAGRVVVIDRYYFSTAAYQGARGVPMDEILVTNEAFAPVPDLLFLFDLPVAEALSRVGARGQGSTAFEKEEYLRTVKALFDSLDRDYLVRVDASRPIEALHAEILTRVLAALPRGSPI